MKLKHKLNVLLKLIITFKYRHPSLDVVNWFQINMALSEGYTEASVQKLE
jgi:hypothetical protein